MKFQLESNMNRQQNMHNSVAFEPLDRQLYNFLCKYFEDVKYRVKGDDGIFTLEGSVQLVVGGVRNREVRMYVDDDIFRALKFDGSSPFSGYSITLELNEDEGRKMKKLIDAIKTTITQKEVVNTIYKDYVDDFQDLVKVVNDKLTAYFYSDQYGVRFDVLDGNILEKSKKLSFYIQPNNTKYSRAYSESVSIDFDGEISFDSDRVSRMFFGNSDSTNINGYDDIKELMFSINDLLSKLENLDMTAYPEFVRIMELKTKVYNVLHENKIAV